MRSLTFWICAACSFSVAVVKERKTTGCRVAVAGCVLSERVKTGGRIVQAGGAAKKRFNTVAVLKMPLVLEMSASSPRTVFGFVKQSSWQTARACGESAKQPSANGISNANASGQCERLIEGFNGRVFVFMERII